MKAAFHKDAPILDRTGRIVAYMNESREVQGDRLFWAIREATPSLAWRDGNTPVAKDELIKCGLWVEYQRGDMQVLGCEIPMNVDPYLVFPRPLFRLPDAPVGDDPAGLVTALKLVRRVFDEGHLPTIVGDQFDYLIRKYEHIAKTERND